MLRPFLAYVFLLATCCFAANQDEPKSDPQALDLAVKSMAALTGGTSIGDATLTGTVTWIAGSDKESGSATLMAKGTGESRVDLDLSAGKRSEIRNDTAAGYPQGVSALYGGTPQPWVLHNCWINASWFFPALSFLSATSDPALVFSYIGPESRAGTAVQHLQVSRYLSGQKANTVALTQQLSTVDFYLDSASLLPAAVTFNAHPDDDASTNLAVEIKFSNYQLQNGGQAPFRIQKLLQGSLVLDIAVTTVAVNSGLADTLFAIQ